MELVWCSVIACHVLLRNVDALTKCFIGISVNSSFHFRSEEVGLKIGEYVLKGCCFIGLRYGRLLKTNKG